MIAKQSLVVAVLRGVRCAVDDMNLCQGNAHTPFKAKKGKDGLQDGKSVA